MSVDRDDGSEAESTSETESDAARVAPPPPIAPGFAPQGLRRFALVLTALHAVLTVVAVLSPGLVRAVIAVVFVVVFLVAIVVFVSAFFTAANRSRTENVSVAGAFFLADGAVASLDRRVFTGAAVVQAVVGIVGSSLRPFSSVAFSVLVALAGLAMMALVGARFGAFRGREP